jgi:hypothetical protein
MRAMMGTSATPEGIRVLAQEKASARALLTILRARGGSPAAKEAETIAACCDATIWPRGLYAATSAASVTEVLHAPTG